MASEYSHVNTKIINSNYYQIYSTVADPGYAPDFSPTKDRWGNALSYYFPDYYLEYCEDGGSTPYVDSLEIVKKELHECLNSQLHVTHA